MCFSLFLYYFNYMDSSPPCQNSIVITNNYKITSLTDDHFVALVHVGYLWLLEQGESRVDALEVQEAELLAGEDTADDHISLAVCGEHSPTASTHT